MKLSFEIPDRDERGVSPVIGVILMVAITVILAAVIASFVLGFGDSVSQSVQAGADISQTNDGNASVTWISQGNAEYLNVSANGEHLPENTSESLSNVGESVDINASALDGEGPDLSVNVVVTAVGSGGSETVVAQDTVAVNRS